MLVRVYTCQNVKLLEISIHGSLLYIVTLQVLNSSELFLNRNNLTNHKMFQYCDPYLNKHFR